jgi:hypothetical protein
LRTAGVFQLVVFDHPLYIPDLPQCSYHLFTYLNNWLVSQRFNNNELEEGVKKWLSFDTGIQKLIPQYDRCLNSDGDYIEK